MKKHAIRKAASATALALIALLTTGCEKSDLVASDILPKACVSCHGSDPVYPLASARAGYDASVHKLGGNAFYANGGGCQQCHTSEGFVAKAKGGAIDPASFVKAPSQPACFSCHDPHGTGTFATRIAQPVKLANAKTFSGGKGNVCAACHQSRAEAAKVAVETEASKVSARFGPHYGPQGDLFAGTNAFEYPGKTYSSSPHREKITDSCVSCHSGMPEGRFSLSPAVGGHSFNIAGEVHEVETLNTAACLSCHQGIKQVAGAAIFDRRASNDYDRDGAVEPFQSEVDGLLHRFMNAEGGGYLQTMAPPFYDRSGQWKPAREGVRGVSQMAALYNFLFFTADRSRGVHNPTYSIQVLYDTIESLDPAFDVSYRP